MKNIVKFLVLITFIGLGLISCTQKQEVQIKELKVQDSLLVRQMEQKDSSIMAYIRSINSIQKNIDTLMVKGRILKMHGEKMSDTATIIAELKAIDNLILKNQKDLASLERKLKSSNEKNQDLVDLGENLSKQLNEKDAEIASIQQELVKTKASLGSMVKQFNDSVDVIVQQRAQIGLMKIEGNTVYYIIGTKSDLKKKGIITEKGGVIGIGRVPVLSHDANTTDFTSADLTELHQIALNGRFVKLVTTHPNDSYKIVSTSPDKILITDSQDFWSKSKYMVAIIK